MTDTEIEELQATLRRLTQVCTRLEEEKDALRQLVKSQAKYITKEVTEKTNAWPWLEVIPDLAKEAAETNRRLQSQVTWMTEKLANDALRVMYTLVKRLGGWTTITGEEILAVGKGASVNVERSKVNDNWVVSIKEPSNERPT